jgi:23S rRNA (cytidine1920-2'-O)/16S rRNA (cytidine1409-2'-O)-methyltransferase
MAARRPKPVPLERLLVKRRLVADRDEARIRVEAGEVRVDGVVVRNPRTQVRPDQPVLVGVEADPWVGRGAHKLLGALADLPMDVAGRVCADLGSSTGGFTQVLLERGAERVYAVDVGRGLLHRSLVTDPRVVVCEDTNARTLERLAEPVDRIVGDLSFVSLRLMLPTVGRLLTPAGEALLLVKPQFEAPKEAVQTGGTLSDTDRTHAITRVLAAVADHGFTVRGRAASRVPGARSGNVEEFVWLVRTPATSRAPEA